MVDFRESFEPLVDHRQRGKVLYPLDEILLLVLLGVLALKGNQGTLANDVETLIVAQMARKLADCVAGIAKTIEKSHGRIETRIISAVGDIGRLQERHDWPGLTSIIVVESRSEMADRCERESRFYSFSSAPIA